MESAHRETRCVQGPAHPLFIKLGRIGDLQLDRVITALFHTGQVAFELVPIALEHLKGVAFLVSTLAFMRGALVLSHASSPVSESHLSP